MLQSMNFMLFCAKNKVMSMVKDERGDVNIVSIVVLIGIAVLLAVVFRGQIESLLDSLFGTINDNATNAVGGGQPTT